MSIASSCARALFQSPPRAKTWATFDVEGDFFVGGRLWETNDFQYARIDAYMAVFDASFGANASNWHDMAITGDQALGKDRFELEFSGTLTEVIGSVFETFSVSVTNASNRSTYDVFANLSLLAIINNNPITINFDFRNTATFGITTADGSCFTSSSGAFLGSDLTPTDTAPVPLPAAPPLHLRGLPFCGDAVLPEPGTGQIGRGRAV